MDTQNSQVIELIRDTIKQGFENTNSKIDRLTESFETHVGKDADYWRKIDEQKAQMRLIKWLGGTGLGTSFTLWILNKLHIL